MEQLHSDKGKEIGSTPFGSDFNCVEVELTESDIEQLEAHIEQKSLPNTGGFFFGDDSYGWDDDDGNPLVEGDYYYKETDTQFITDARTALKDGKKVYYNSWW